MDAVTWKAADAPARAGVDPWDWFGGETLDFEADWEWHVRPVKDLGGSIALASSGASASLSGGVPGEVYLVSVSGRSREARALYAATCLRVIAAANGLCAATATPVNWR